jgi:DNA polymerase III alpha subunit
VVGELCTLLFEGRDAEAGQVSDWYQSVFGDDYYYEIHDHGLPREAVAMNKLLNLAYHSKIPVVLANDCHYLQRRESIAIDALNCIRKGMDFSHPDAKRFACNEYYFKTPKEMKALYSFPPDLIRNSLLIADKIELDLSETIDDGWIDQLEYYRWTPAELYRELLQVLRVPREKIVELCDLIPPEAENLAEAIEYSTDFSCLTSEDAVCSQALDIGISLANTFSRFELSDKTPWIP